MNKLESEKNVISGQQVLVAYPACPDDEINLVDIWKILCKGKKVIIGSVIASMLVALVVVLLLPKIYRAKTVLLPPQLSDVVALSIPGIYTADSQIVYQGFLINLHSHGLRYQYFKNFLLSDFQGKQQNDKVDDYEIFIKSFDKLLKIISKPQGKAQKNNFTTVTLDGKNYDRLADWLGKYIVLVDQHTVKKLVSDIQSQLKLRAEEIREQIATLRSVASRERQDRIARLKEAYIIAKLLQIEKPTGSTFVAGDKKKTPETRKTGLIFGSNEVPLYFRGYLALQGELEQLQNRKNDDSFIVGLRELQGKLSFLEKKKIDSKTVHAVQVDQRARTDGKPVKPKSTLIMLLGVVFGVIIGILAALIRNVSSFKDISDNRMSNG